MRDDDLSDLERQILEHCSHLFGMLKRDLEGRYGWRLHRLELFFLRKRHVNAIVLDMGKRHGVGVHVGLVFQFFRVVRQALADPNVLPQYLSLAGLKAPKRSNRRLSSEPSLGPRFLTLNKLSAEREEWFWPIFGLMMEHVFLHEAAHALRGHLRFARMHLGAALIDELSAAREYCKPAIRDLEVDADVHAIDMWIEVCERDSEFPSGQALRADLLFQKLFTTILVYQILDSTRRPIGKHLPSKHPSPVHRAMMLCTALADTFRRHFGVSAALAKEAHHQAWWEASIVARSLQLVRNRWWGSSTNRQAQSVYREIWKVYVQKAEKQLDAFVEKMPDSLV